MLANTLAVRTAAPAPALSVLDLSPVPSGSTPADALRNTIDLARHADTLGFARYWLAEHHNAAGVASSAPEVMIAPIAAVTSRIRVGSGGIMLPNHSALKVAETFPSGAHRPRRRSCGGHGQQDGARASSLARSAGRRRFRGAARRADGPADERSRSRDALRSAQGGGAYAYDADEEQLRGLTRARSVVGAAESVGRTLRALVDESQADEVMATTTVHHHGERKRSYERLLGALRG